MEECGERRILTVSMTVKGHRQCMEKVSSLPIVSSSTANSGKKSAEGLDTLLEIADILADNFVHFLGTI